jgi:hypothetical protein
MPAWTLANQTTVNILPRDAWFYRPIPVDPLLVRVGFKVEPSKPLGLNVNAAGFHAYVVLSDGILNWGRSRITPFNALQPDKSIFVVSPTPQTSWTDLGTDRFIAFSLPRWFPETAISIWTYI